MKETRNNMKLFSIKTGSRLILIETMLHEYMLSFCEMWVLFFFLIVCLFVLNQPCIFVLAKILFSF